MLRARSTASRTTSSSATVCNAAVPHQPPAVAQHVDDVGRFRGVDDPRVDAAGIAGECRHGVHARHVQHDQVGALPGFELSGQMAEVQRRGAESRGHRQGGPGGDRGWIAGDALARSAASRVSSNMSRLLFDAAPSVPMPTLTPSPSIFGDPSDAGGQLQVAAWVVRDARAEILERPYFPLVDVHAVRGEHLRVEEALLAHVGNARHAVLATDTSTSSSVSDRWMCSGTSNSAASSAQDRRMSGVHVYGACGAGAGTINGWPFQRSMNSRARARPSS